MKTMNSEKDSNTPT